MVILSPIPSENKRSNVMKCLDRDLSKISAWCTLWCMKLNLKIGKSMVLSKPRTVFPPHYYFLSLFFYKLYFLDCMKHF